MSRNTVALDGLVEPGDDGLEQPRGTRWQRFFTSWTWAVILVAACAVGLFMIVRANPFASASVSDRISAKLGQPVTCTEVGAAQVAGTHSTIYKCTVGLKAHRLAQCFAVNGSDVAQISGTRKLGC